jgi:hypothetical protein
MNVLDVQASARSNVVPVRGPSVHSQMTRSSSFLSHLTFQSAQAIVQCVPVASPSHSIFRLGGSSESEPQPGVTRVNVASVRRAQVRRIMIALFSRQSGA